MAAAIVTTLLALLVGSAGVLFNSIPMGLFSLVFATVAHALITAKQ